MARDSSSLPGRGSVSIPGSSRNGQTNGRASGSGAAYIEIDDDDADELADDKVPCSSPYFTQPTQIVNRATQPTQIVNRKTLKQPSSPLVPNTPGTIIEVPASSPFQDKSQARPSSDRKPSMGSKVGSLMAPAGTSFKPPAMRTDQARSKASNGRKGYLEISDDELLEDYKKRDSSDDDTPIRGDIRPSSFLKKENSALSSKSRVIWPLDTDIPLNDISDTRLRHLTDQVYRIVQKVKPGITVRACRDAVREDAGWQVSKAVDFLTGRATKSLSLSRSTNATSDKTVTTPGGVGSNSISSSLRHTAQTARTSSRNTLHSFLQKGQPTTSRDSSQTSTQHSQLSHQQSLSNSINSATSNRNPSHKRLIQGRPNSSTPSAVFSLSSSSSSPLTSPSGSQENSLSASSIMPQSKKTSHHPNANSKASTQSSRPSKAMTQPTPAPKASPPRRRRLIQGRRNPSPSPAPTPAPAPVTISSDSDSEEDPRPAPARLTRSLKRRADAPDSRGTSKKLKLNTELKSLPRKRMSDESESSESDSNTPPPSKKAKTNGDKESSRPAKPTHSKKRKAEDELEEEPASPIAFSEAGSSEAPTEELTHVLEYLNQCSQETLGRMIGSSADAKLMVSARPFSNIRDAKAVTQLEKAKAKSQRKTRRVAIGEAIVEKLNSWMEACEAATVVINECDNRGQEISSAMSNWSVDKNGKPRTDEDNLEEMPIKKQPKLMDENVVQLKSYQLVGLNWMDLLHSKGYSGILADDMGLGKTCEIISLITHLAGSNRDLTHLIVVPPTNFDNWMDEFRRFAPGIKVFGYSGKDRGMTNPDWARENHDVVLTTYPQIERRAEDLQFLQEMEFHAAIFDEGHKLKNKETMIYKQLMRVPSKFRLILSGTPVQNNLKELLTLLRFIEPGLFEKNSFEMLSTIFEAKVASKDVLNFAALASERVERARAVMAPFILQRRKEDVIDLPAKIERLEQVPMHKVQQEIYDSIQKGLKLSGIKKSKDAHPWLQLKKAAIHHQLFRHHFTDEKVDKMLDILWDRCSAEELCVQDKSDRYKDRLREELRGKSDFQLHLECKEFKRYIGHLDIPQGSWEESPKVKKLLELVRTYQENGDRVLVFSRFEMVVDILRETLHHAGIRYCCLTGNLDTKERQPEISNFMNDPDIPVFLLTTGSGGAGINLTAANKIIIFDQSDNPQDDVQASNRAHRIGQKRDVEVIRLITKGSVEGLIYNSCVKKLVLASRMERDFAVETEGESVEEECKRRMLLGEDGDEAAEEALALQQQEA
ncbi:hypothetical protein M426DRAFT_13637 [Hypoxylon sp. CI-4A]|nr:hypothetical protein M426DRAFT_13637 [Hypoxylon sp. CI-4A]